MGSGRARQSAWRRVHRGGWMRSSGDANGSEEAIKSWQGRSKVRFPARVFAVSAMWGAAGRIRELHILWCAALPGPRFHDLHGPARGPARQGSIPRLHRTLQVFRLSNRTDREITYIRSDPGRHALLLGLDSRSWRFAYRCDGRRYPMAWCGGGLHHLNTTAPPGTR
jgi:hypothetical protein